MKKTAFNLIHKQLGAKLVDFGGWEMPVSYEGVLKEHFAVRNAAGLFDVSHMGEILVQGRQAKDFLQMLTCNDLNLMKEGQCQYNLIMNEKGGVVDDIIIYKENDDSYFICVNASNIEKDFDYFKAYSSPYQVTFENLSEAYSQIALQGPLALALFMQHFPSLASVGQLKSFHFSKYLFDSQELLISRTGYTGEDGLEIYGSYVALEQIWVTLIEKCKAQGLKACGLGARDVLRLEAAYPLYGHELSDSISPLEASLAWTVKLNKGSFLGRDQLMKQKEEGLSQKRVGLIMEDRAIAREHYPILAAENKIGFISSGTYSPSLDKNIACGYVPSQFSEKGTEICVEVRAKPNRARVCELPFYKRRSL